ncbi:MAG: hypothetical protein ACRDRA_00225 [Pseudonocardiaceae bacterium]
MSHVLSFTYLEQQQVELLPARTVLSMFATQGTDSGSGDGFGPALVKMLGMTSGGHSTPGPDGSDGHPQPNS